MRLHNNFTPQDELVVELVPRECHESLNAHLLGDRVVASDATRGQARVRGSFSPLRNGVNSPL